MARGARVSLPLATRLILRGLSELEERGLTDTARAGHRRLWASVVADPTATEARLQVAQALLRLGVPAAPDVLDEACAAWRQVGALGARAETRARGVAIGLVRAALASRRVAAAAAVSAAEAERAPDHALALYARGRLAILEGDPAAGERLLARAARGTDARVAARARAVLANVPDERLPRPGEPLPPDLSPAARLALARRLSRSAGRYARVRGLDIVLETAPVAPAEALRAAALHVDVAGARLTDIERDRLRAIARRLPAELAGAAGDLSAAIELRARLGPLPPPAKVELLATDGPAAVAALAQAVRRGTGPWPESHDPACALAAETLRVRDALRAGAPAQLDRLVSLFDAAGPTAPLVPTLWVLFPAFVARHAELGLAAERLRPILAAVLEHGPIRTLDPALLCRALDAIGEDDLAGRAARRAAEEGNPAPLRDRLVRRAFRLEGAEPEEALRLLDRAARLEA